MSINNPTIASHNAPVLLGSVDTINMQTEVATTLFTVPTGKVFVPHFIIVRNVSANLTGCILTFGQVGTLTDFLPSQTLTNINTVGAAVILRPIPHATPALEIIQYTAGEVFQMDVATAATGAATATIEVFGTLDDA